MDWAGECAVVIPCFNEAAGVASVIRGVLPYLPRVFIVDDGSTDETARVASAAGACVLRQPANLGKGAALIRGWNQARSEGFQWTLCLDGDGQHDPDDIPAFLVQAARSGADLLIGNRFHNGPPSMPALRRVVNRWMSRRLSRHSGQALPDTQCGFRLLRLSRLPQLDRLAPRFEIESALLLAVLQAGGRVEFVPIHSKPRATPSKIRPVQDAWRWICWWWTVRSSTHPRATRESQPGRAGTPLPAASGALRTARPALDGRFMATDQVHAKQDAPPRPHES